jgi:hypothetical protein
MSTSPDDRQRGNFFGQPESEPNPPDWRKLIPLKGLLWSGAVIAVFVLLGIYWELAWEILAEFVPLALESAEQALDTVFEAVGLSPAIAQMATAYTGFVVLLVTLYFLLRKSISVSRRTRETIALYKATYSTVGRRWWEGTRAAVLGWWRDLDWLHKIATVAALVLIGIPVALFLSFVLGSIVAALL